MKKGRNLYFLLAKDQGKRFSGKYKVGQLALSNINRKKMIYGKNYRLLVSG